MAAPSGTEAAGNLRVAKDFQVEQLYTVPKETQGSWVNMCVDPKGRLIVSDQYGALYRVTPPAPGHAASETRVEQIPVNLGEAQGLLWAFDSLYVVVNRGGKFESGLYRVRDTNGDDQLDEVRQLRKIDGGSEHGPHAVLLHPDGKSLVVVCGNHTKPTPFDASRVPRAWGEDHLIPRMWDAGGHAVGILAPGGWIARTDPEGKSWELLSMGYRNEFDAAFNREGELFTYDADMEWDMNTPWYRPTRVCHAVSGSEYGWRSGSGKWPVYYPDSLPPVVNVGPGSPTGVCFGYGTRFPARYQEALFMCDWSYGKLYATHLIPSGSTYRGELEEFLTGTPLPLTDVTVNPRDGALYFTVGGRKTQSALYRVTYVGSLPTAPAPATRDGLAELRETRRKLESFHGHKDPKTVPLVWPYLHHSDRFIRAAARIAIEHQDPVQWQERALREKDTEAALASLLALARVGDKSLQPRLLESLGRIAWRHLTDARRLELLRIYSLAFIRMGPPDAATAAAVTARFDPLFPAPSRDLNAELSKLLIYLQSPSAASKTLALLAKAPTQEEQMDYAYSLRVLTAGWTPELREQYFRWFVKAGNFHGGHSFAGFVRNIKSEAIKTLSDAERLALKPVLEAKVEKKSPLEVLSSGRLAGRPTHEWTVEELAGVAEKGLKGGRSFERGRELFGAAACAACHRFNNEGGSYGPDLTGAVGRFSSKDLLESIILPSKEVSDQYAPVIVKRKDGETVTGRIVNLAGESVMISPNLFDPDDLVSVERKDILSMEPAKVSQMPEGLLNSLRQEEILDLVAYLLSRGDARHPMFKSN
ncbi:MAG TPA: heme-binding protein [Verrucomicrobiales bacterium]|nr:heme-binding protein [Verrucomicrobiales bacterium]